MNTLAFTLMLCVAGAELPTADSTKTIECFRVPSYCEGIVFDHAGYGYVSHGKQITRFKKQVVAGKTTYNPKVWAETGGPNGHKVLADGTHLVCDHFQHAVLKLDAYGKVIGKASEECEGQKLRGPNDLTLDTANGGFYFTDPGGSDDKKPIGTVHYVTKEGKTLLVAEGFAFPNGIVLTPDGKRLLMAESKKNRIVEFPVLAPGKVGPLKVFAELPTKMGEQIDNQPDGICLDSHGNLYVAHYGMKQVQVLSPEGKLIRRYNGGNMTTSNVAFDPTMETLFITGGIAGEGNSEGGVFEIHLPGVKGLRILPERIK